MKQTKQIPAIITILGLSFASLLSLARGREHQPDTVVVKGTVLDPDSGTPLVGVHICWNSEKVITDHAGHYEINLPIGVREVSFSATDRPAAKKVVILRVVGATVRQDVLLPASTRAQQAYVLAMDRGSRPGLKGKHKEQQVADISGDSTISSADEFGNHDQFLKVNAGNFHVYSPVWLNAVTIAFAKDGVVHNAQNSKDLGVFTIQRESAQIQQIASIVGARSLSRAPDSKTLAIATSRELYVTGAITRDTSLRRVFSLGPDDGFLLSVDFGPDRRVYLTIDDSLPLDDRHYLTRSRIASVNTDGSLPDSKWAADVNYSFRYPANMLGEEMIFCRFALDGRQQQLWSRNLRTGKTELVAEPALRAVHLDASANRLYYIYQQDLHLRDLKSGADWVIVNSVRQADYLRP